MWIYRVPVVRRQDERAGGGHGGGTALREERDGGSSGHAEQRSTRARGAVLLVLGEREARGVAEGMGVHSGMGARGAQLGVVLGGDGFAHPRPPGSHPTYSSLMILSKRGTGGGVVRGSAPGGWFGGRARG